MGRRDTLCLLALVGLVLHSRAIRRFCPSGCAPTGMARRRALTLSLSLVVDVSGHGQITHPPSTRHGGSLAEAGRCDSQACMWFSQPTSIPGPPTVNAKRYRTFNVDVSGGPRDWSRTMPWRAPGTAPVQGSGCGVSGGGPVPLANGGKAAPSMPPQGSDGLLLPRRPPVEWRRGSVQEVAWAINANHGGGCAPSGGPEPHEPSRQRIPRPICFPAPRADSYRLCKLGPNVSEDCFQRNVLRFAGVTQWMQVRRE